MAESKKLFLLDAMALIYRAYFALNKNPRINSKGLNTSAVLGFANTLFEVLRTENPSHIGVAFDTIAPTARHIEFTDYTLESCGYGGIKTTVDGCQCTNRLYAVTHRFATAAHDTFIHVAYHRRRTVYFEGGLFALISYLADSQVVGNGLQFAITVAAASQAAGGMI